VTQIRLQYFKSIEDYNHAIHKVCAKLWFCEKEPSEEDKIEKSLQTMLPSDRVLQHQYRAQNYQHYADLIRDLLQTEKHDEVTIKNHHQCRVGAVLLSLRFTTMRRKQVLLRIQFQRKMVGVLGVDTIGRKTETSQSR
jgi:hypothetical protein